MDIMPTMLEWAGCPVPGGVQGKSVLPRLKDASLNGHAWVMTQNFYRNGPVHAMTLEDVNTLVTPQWKYTLRSDSDTGQLYNRIADPEELRNLWHDPAHATIRAQLGEQLAVALSAANEPDWRREAAW